MVLCSGSQGFIGSHLMAKFRDWKTQGKIDFDSVGLDRVNNGHLHNFLHVDLLDKTKLFWAIHNLNIEYVFHNAAVPSVPGSYENPMQTYLNNVNASINLIDVCLKLGVKKLIFASSSSVLGPSPYGHSKRVIEEMLAHSGLNYTVLRYFNVFGENQRENVVKIMADALRNNEKIVINGDGSTTRDFSFVDNVVRANLKAMSSTYDGQILDVGTGKPTSLMLLYKKLRSKINPTHDKLEFGPDRIGDIKYSCAKTFLQEDEIIHFNEGIDRWLSQSSAWDNWVVRSAGTSQNLQTMN